MRKRIIIGKIFDPRVSCGHAGMEVEVVLNYDGEELEHGVDWTETEGANFQEELLDFEGQRVRITIEEIDATPG
jgi:hypothetical protein